MQTFNPYADFEKSARVLDWRRLGKQRSEARQIHRAILHGGGWSNHTAVNMWRGYEDALIEYGDVIIREWVRRGYKNTMPIIGVTATVYPPWLGDEAFHLAHKSNLIRKKPEYYRKFWPDVPDDLPYIWPGRK